MKSRTGILFAVLGLLTLFLFLLDISVGAVDIPLADVWKSLTGGDVSKTIAAIVIDIRLVKSIVALLAGAALSVSGLQMQTLFRNPLAGQLRSRHKLRRQSGSGAGCARRCRVRFRNSRGCVDGRCRGFNRDSSCGTAHQGYHDNSYSWHDVFIRSGGCSPDTPVSQQ